MFMPLGDFSPLKSFLSLASRIEADLLSDPLTETATEQMSVSRRCQRKGDQKIHSFDPEANLCKQKQPQFTVEELGAEQHKLIGRKLKRF